MQLKVAQATNRLEQWFGCDDLYAIMLAAGGISVLDFEWPLHGMWTSWLGEVSLPADHPYSWIEQAP